MRSGLPLATPVFAQYAWARLIRLCKSSLAASMSRFADLMDAANSTWLALNSSIERGRDEEDASRSESSRLLPAADEDALFGPMLIFCVCENIWPYNVQHICASIWSYDGEDLIEFRKW